MAKKQTIEKLVKDLNNKKKKWDVREAAAIALGESGEADAIEPLVNALSEPYILFKGKVIDALVKLEEKQEMVWLLLTVALRDVSNPVKLRIGAAMALGKIKNENAVGVLIEALTTQEDSSSVFMNRLALESAAARVIGASDPNAAKQFVDLTQKTFEHTEVRGWVAIALGDQGDEKAVEPLIHVLKNDDPFLKIFAAGALGKIGDKRAIKPLQKLLKKENKPEIKEAIEEALEKLSK
ncbi:MAG: HEAT repeat domain-containing protein [Candidatus Heimdallarchaeaceae archaeon]